MDRRQEDEEIQKKRGAWTAMLAVASVLRGFNVEEKYCNVVTGPSMEPTILHGDRLVGSRLDAGNITLKRGDIVVIDRRRKSSDEWAVKRIVALPGEKIEVEAIGSVLVNGRPLEEPYCKMDCDRDNEAQRPLVVPENHYYVMGDNRANSLDSRAYGPVPRGRIIVLFEFFYWPPEKISTDLYALRPFFK